MKRESLLVGPGLASAKADLAFDEARFRRESARYGRCRRKASETSRQEWCWRSSRNHRVCRSRARSCAHGAVNVPPDSFFDGGRYVTAESAAGGSIRSSTQAPPSWTWEANRRPRADPVPAALKSIAWAGASSRKRTRALVSIDTTTRRSQNLRSARARDRKRVSCLTDPELADVAARTGAALVIMHSRGPMSRMPGSPSGQNGYTDGDHEVRGEPRSRPASAVSRGVRPEHVWLGPRLGIFERRATLFRLCEGSAKLATNGLDHGSGAWRKSFSRRWTRRRRRTVSAAHRRGARRGRARAPRSARSRPCVRSDIALAVMVSTRCERTRSAPSWVACSTISWGAAPRAVRDFVDVPLSTISRTERCSYFAAPAPCRVGIGLLWCSCCNVVSGTPPRTLLSDSEL